MPDRILPRLLIVMSLYTYRRETEFFTVFREEQGMVPRHIFEEFIAFAHDSDLEDVLTLQTKLYRCAHIFLGNYSECNGNLFMYNYILI